MYHARPDSQLAISEALPVVGSIYKKLFRKAKSNLVSDIGVSTSGKFNP
jgi:hypothetical protein